MVLKLDPHFRLLWRSPTSLQFGVDTPLVTLSNVSSADDRMIAALVSGVSRSGLSMIGTDAGADEPDVVALLNALTPALLSGEVEAPLPQQVSLSGSGLTADSIASTLSSSGIDVRRHDQAHDASEGQVDLAIIIAHFVIEPDLHGVWLRRDVPHLAVVFGDSRVRIGPVVEPGTTPCLYCLERWATDADQARPALAAQLWGNRSPAETEIVANEVAALVTRYAVSRLGGLQHGALFAPATSLELEVVTGQITKHTWLPHPSCACLTLATDSAQATDSALATDHALPRDPALSENDWRVAHHALHHSPPALPMTSAAAAVPA